MRMWCDDSSKSGRHLRSYYSGREARDQARPESDLDLLVIEESDLPRYKRAARYFRALVGLFPKNDVVVWTPEGVAAWAQAPNAFITTALREGRTLYGR